MKPRSSTNWDTFSGGANRVKEVKWHDSGSFQKERLIPLKSSRPASVTSQGGGDTGRAVPRWSLYDDWMERTVALRRAAVRRSCPRHLVITSLSAGLDDVAAHANGSRGSGSANYTTPASSAEWPQPAHFQHNKCTGQVKLELGAHLHHVYMAQRLASMDQGD